jgi:hypothetical protein
MLVLLLFPNKRTAEDDGTLTIFKNTTNIKTASTIILAIALIIN